jgi:lipoic acid synthetase
MELGYVVITSVDRDDLPDGGAAQFAACLRAVRESAPRARIELLTPDFRRCQDQALQTLAPLAPFVWGHNVETVPRLYRAVRPGSEYHDTLGLLARAAALDGVVAKSSMMLGLGETTDEVLAVIDDLVAAGVERLTIGQYLRPTERQLRVVEFIAPEAFTRLADAARARGMRWAIASPFARSSYYAELEPGVEPPDGTQKRQESCTSTIFGEA